MIDKKINCINYAITDSIAEKKSKNDDFTLMTQKQIDKRVKKELKQTLKHSKELLPVDSSTRSIQKSDIDHSASIMDTYLSSSLYSSKKPKATKSNLNASQDKSDPNSSFLPNSTNSENISLKEKEPTVNNQFVRRAFNEELPKSILVPLKYVERLLSQNQFHYNQIAYKDYPVVLESLETKTTKQPGELGLSLDVVDNREEEEQKKLLEKKMALVVDNTGIPNIKKLLTYSIDLLLKEKGINHNYVCHALDWNKNNPDLLAAVYGDPDINSKEPGFLCFWTLKNPLHPERVIQTNRGLTYCNFSRKNPYLIVVSDYQGEIMIYDLRNNTNKPMADSSEVKDKHTDIVWECKWIERPNDKNEIIITTNIDGKMKDWSLKKGLEVTDLLKMKKSTSFPMKQLNP